MYMLVEQEMTRDHTVVCNEETNCFITNIDTIYSATYGGVYEEFREDRTREVRALIKNPETHSTLHIWSGTYNDLIDGWNVNVGL